MFIIYHLSKFNFSEFLHVNHLTHIINYKEQRLYKGMAVAVIISTVFDT